MTNQKDSNTRFQFRSGDKQIPIPAEKLEDAIQWVRDSQPKLSEHDFILDQNSYDMVRENRTIFEDGIVARFKSDGEMRFFDTVEDIQVFDRVEVVRNEFFRCPVERRLEFIDRYKPMFHHIFADGWDPSLAKLKKDQIVVGKTYQALCDNGEFDQQVIALDVTYDIHHPDVDDREKYARVYDVRFGKEYAYFIEVDRLREARPELKSFKGYYCKRSNHENYLIPAESLEEALEWINSLDRQPDHGDSIVDESVYDMAASGQLHLIDVRVAKFNEDRWEIMDPREEARDKFFKTPMEHRDSFMTIYKPEFHEIFSENWKPESRVLQDELNPVI